MTNIDVIISVYGKPYQTLCTLKSLMLYSGQHIDKIYFIQEKEQPYNENIDFVLKEFDNIIHFTPKKYMFIKRTDCEMNDVNNRYVFRYQYGIENTDKKYVLICHNDVLFKGDIIGDMIEQIAENAGIGLIGQCWNCPAFKSELCDGDNYQNYKPSLQEITELLKKHLSPRTTIDNINKESIMPLPECRLNEFACLLDVEIANKECYPNGDTPLFGAYDILDVGGAYFRSLTLKGYKFKNYDITEKAEHCFYAKYPGYPVQLDKNRYVESEKFAKQYYEQNFKESK